MKNDRVSSYRRSASLYRADAADFRRKGDHHHAELAMKFAKEMEAYARAEVEAENEAALEAA